MAIKYKMVFFFFNFVYESFFFFLQVCLIIHKMRKNIYPLKKVMEILQFIFCKKKKKNASIQFCILHERQIIFKKKTSHILHTMLDHW